MPIGQSTKAGDGYFSILNKVYFYIVGGSLVKSVIILVRFTKMFVETTFLGSVMTISNQ